MDFDIDLQNRMEYFVRIWWIYDSHWAQICSDLLIRLGRGVNWFEILIWRPIPGQDCNCFNESNHKQPRMGRMLFCLHVTSSSCKVKSWRRETATFCLRSYLLYELWFLLVPMIMRLGIRDVRGAVLIMTAICSSYTPNDTLSIEYKCILFRCNTMLTCTLVSKSKAIDSSLASRIIGH